MAALADVAALAPAKVCYEAGLSGMESEFSRYMEAVSTLERCGVPRERLMTEKAEVYGRLAELNHQIRQAQREKALCQEILGQIPQMEAELQKTATKEREVRNNEHRRR